MPKGIWDRPACTPDSDRERFLSHTEQVGDCLEWRSQIIEWSPLTRRGGYGLAHWPRSTAHYGKKTTAHRVAYELFTGESVVGKIVAHRCDNRLCVNVEHLFLATYKENTQDMLAKERGRYQRWANGRVAA